MCEQYWPSQGLQAYGDVSVMLGEETQDPHIVIRRLKVAKVKKKQ